MRRSSSVLVLVLACGTCSCTAIVRHGDDPLPRVRGPLPMRIEHPVRLMALALPPRSAHAQDPGTFALRASSSYTSVFSHGNNGFERVLLDGELAREALALRWGVAPGTDVEVELATLYATSGFLDRFVESWHDLLGLPQGGRETRPRFAYDMELERDGDVYYHLDGNEPGVEDVPITLTHELVAESASTPAIALRLGVELPLGDEAAGFGNGGVDWGVGVLAEKSFGRWTLSGSSDFVDPARPSSFVGSGVDLRSGLGARGGLEYRWNDRVSLLAGLSIDPPVVTGMTLKEIDRDVLSLDLGGAIDVGERSLVHIGFQEDLIAKSGPDFTAFVAWTWSF